MAVEELPCRWRERPLAVALRGVLLGVEDELGLPCKCCVVLWVSPTSVLDELYYHWCVLGLVYNLLGTDPALLSGTIGFLSSYWAIRRLYFAIRID